ncbi:MAG: hypothetical protein CMJ75_11155 [Planctomycetaceae bacterium]|nr:hypothetical protein [Planctomycetaceae bacterium]
MSCAAVLQITPLRNAVLQITPLRNRVLVRVVASVFSIVSFGNRWLKFRAARTRNPLVFLVVSVPARIGR